MKKIKDGVVKKNTLEYERMIDSLSKICGLNFTDLENCIEITFQ